MIFSKTYCMDSNGVPTLLHSFHSSRTAILVQQAWCMGEDDLNLVKPSTLPDLIALPSSWACHRLLCNQSWLPVGARTYGVLATTDDVRCLIQGSLKGLLFPFSPLWIWAERCKQKGHVTSTALSSTSVAPIITTRAGLSGQMQVWAPVPSRYLCPQRTSWVVEGAGLHGSSDAQHWCTQARGFAVTNPHQRHCTLCCALHRTSRAIMRGHQICCTAFEIHARVLEGAQTHDTDLHQAYVLLHISAA